MPFALVLLLAAGVVQSEPLALEASRAATVVDIRFELTKPLPGDLSTALASGAEVRLTYPLRLKAKRKAWWDRRVWSGELVTIVAFDPVTGRYRCALVLDGIITANREVESLESATAWLRAPEPVRVEVPENRRRATLKVRVRAVFSSGTTWLIFPTQDATPWVEITLPPPPEPSADAD
jgi:hypothetical protein